MIPACLTGFGAVAQTAPKELPLVSVGYGLTQFSGDVGRTNTTGGAFRSSMRFGVEQRFGSWVGAEVFGNFGKLAKGERSVTLNRNFESQFLFVGINGILYLDNNVVLKRDAPFVPYLAAGFGWMSFDPHGDLKDKNDSNYNYWSDGSIHSRPESDPLANNSTFLNRDYTYETQLKDSAVNYTRSTFGIPLSVGFRWKFGTNAGANIQASYFLTFSDYIDNVKDGGNDSWMFFGASLYYKFGNADRQQEKLPEQTALTPVATEDVVAENVEITSAAERDSINEAQKNKFEQNPSQETLKQGNADIDLKSGPDCIPEEFRAADINKDCVITADEINTVIDNFFDGIGNWTADGINRLIDFFFDQ